MLDFIKSMEEHNQRIKTLIDKYIGQKTLDLCHSAPDIYAKKRWYLTQIRLLEYWKGQNSVWLRRCKYESEKWHKYNNGMRDLDSLIEELQIELLSL